MALHGEGTTNTQAEQSWKVKVYHMSRILIKQSNSLLHTCRYYVLYVGNLSGTRLIWLGLADSQTT